MLPMTIRPYFSDAADRILSSFFWIRWDVVCSAQVPTFNLH